MKKLAKSLLRIVAALAIILGVPALCYWGWQPGSNEPLPEYANNAIWLGHDRLEETAGTSYIGLDIIADIHHTVDKFYPLKVASQKSDLHMAGIRFSNQCLQLQLNILDKT